MLNWKTLKKLGEAVLYGNILGSIKTQDQVKIQLDAARELFKQNIGRVYEDTLPSISEVEAKEGDMCILIVDDEYTPYTVVNGEWQKYTTVEGATTEADLTDYYTKAETIEFVNTKTSDCAHKVEDNIFSGSNTFLGALIGNLIGNLTGNADTATKATKDSEGNVIKDTYATKTECNSKASLDATQMLAVNSGITASKVAEYEAMKTSKVNEADIKTVAKTGSYSDLINKPTINNSTINIKVNGVSIGTFTTNSANPKDIAITVPTKMSDLDNDSDYVASTTLHDYVKNTDLTAHTSDNNIHVTTSDKDKWNAKQDALTSQQIQNIADVTNKANDSDVVHKSGDETIDGVKAFNDTIKAKALFVNTNTSNNGFQCYGSSMAIISSYGGGTVPESNINPFRFYIGKSRSYANAPIVIDTGIYPSGGTSITLRSASNESANALDHRFIVGTEITNNDDGTKTKNAYVNFYNTNYLRPNKNNYCDLGTTSSKWKDVNTNAINGIDPGVLSFPDYNSVNVINLTNNITSGAWYSRTADFDGWVCVFAHGTKVKVLLSGWQYGQTSVGEQTDRAVVFPVKKGYVFDIYVEFIANLRAYLVPCIGNV